MAHLTALGVKAASNGEKGSTINGVVTPIKGAGDGAIASLPQEVLDREVGYTPIACDSSMCEFLGWSKLPEHSIVWLFVPNSPTGGEPGHGLKDASYSHPILQTYVDICILGCLEHSREFAIEFIMTTVGWDRPWLNDRKVPRRPWVHQPEYRKVDNLLQEVIPELFKNRMLPTDFGAHAIKEAKEAKSNDNTARPVQRLGSFQSDGLLASVLDF
tara:strand:- start:205 stop:849 length:645 start_codon:yes stop_codon:yes gene_type:complete